MNRLGRRQVAINATSRDQWEAFGEHRERLTALLAGEGTERQSRLCVLGAGNANDLELTALLAVHGEVHLKATITAGCTLGSYSRPCAATRRFGR